MTSTLLAHQGKQLQPHDLWQEWAADPLVALFLVAGIWIYVRGWRRPHPRRPARRGRCAALGFVAIAVALMSPLDSLSSSLASAHMVQHVVLVLVAAPLLALGTVGATMLQSVPLGPRRRLRRAVRDLGIEALGRNLRRPAVAWLLHAAVLWLWHSAVLYDAAVRNPLVHGLEHTTFLATAVLFWSLLIGVRSVSAGAGVLLVFTMAMQSVVLAALLTFSPEPWYASYASTTQAWGLDRLTDQQLAGVVMWVPAGFIYVGAAIALLVRWMSEAERAGSRWPPHPASVDR